MTITTNRLRISTWRLFNYNRAHRNVMKGLHNMEVAGFTYMDEVTKDLFMSEGVGIKSWQDFKKIK